MQFPLSDEPRFGRKASRWFRFRIADWLEKYATQGGVGVVTKPDMLAALADWFAEMPRRYVKWVAAERYGGSRYSSGGWQLKEKAILDDLAEGLVEATRIAAATANAQFTSLDEWLAADLKGTITATPLGGSHELPEATRVALSILKKGRERPWYLIPRTCPSCSNEWTMRPIGSKHFVLDRQSKRCPACRDQARQQRKARTESK